MGGEKKNKTGSIHALNVCGNVEREYLDSRTLTCGTATDRQSTLTLGDHAQLGACTEVGLAASGLDKWWVGVLWLTWGTSSAATLKVQVLEVDLEILLLSFLAPILWG